MTSASQIGNAMNYMYILVSLDQVVISDNNRSSHA